MPSVTSSPSVRKSASPFHAFVAGALLVLAAFAAYHNSFSGQLVYDDIAAIKENPTINHLWPLSSVLAPPSDTGVTVNGRPLVNLSLAINYAIGGYEVGSYHVLNLVIHLLAGLALFGLLRRSLELPSLRNRFGPGDVAVPFAFTIALLWMVHPLQTESVTYVVQRAESLAGLFYFVTFYCFVRSLTSPRPLLWHSLSVASCFCGMASKEVMASAPLLLLFYDRALVSGTFQAAWQRHRRLYVGLASSWLLLAFLMSISRDRGGTVGFHAEGANAWHYALTQCLALGKYLKLSFWPSPIVFDYGTAVETSLVSVLPQALLIVSLVVASAYALWRHPIMGFLGAWFFAILAPSSSFIPIVTETMAEHRMYLPLAGVLSLTVLGAGVWAGRRILPLFLGLALIAGFLTTQRNHDYRDELTLWRDTQQKYPTNARAHNNLGEILFRQEKKEEALACFREAVRLLPNYVDAINNLANTLTQLGHPDEALPLLLGALELRPKYAETFNNIGNAYHELGRIDDAVLNYRESVALKPKFADAWSNLGVALAKQGHPAEAIPCFETALRLKRDYVEAHYSYASALDSVGRTAEATEQFKLSLALKPTYPEAHNNLGGILFKRGNQTEALRYFETAIRLKPNYPDALHNRGVALFQLGHPEEAVGDLLQAIRLKPDYQLAKEHLALVYNTLGGNAFKAGQMDEATSFFAKAVEQNPSDAEAQNNLGVVLWRMGKLREAERHFSEAVRLVPDYADARNSLAQVRNLIGTP